MMPEVKRSLLIINILILLTSCTKNQNAAQDFVAPPKASQVSPAETAATYKSSSSKIDLDLTKMSATMIYSTIFDMLLRSEEYENQNIKIKGNFNILTDDENGSVHYAILIPDATACCVQGLEFFWEGNHKYPEDYPVENQEITLTGRYRITEDEFGLQRTFLQVTELIF